MQKNKEEGNAKLVRKTENFSSDILYNIKKLKPSTEYKFYYILDRMRKCGLNAMERIRQTKRTSAHWSTTLTRDFPRTTTLTRIRRVMSVLQSL